MPKKKKIPGADSSPGKLPSTEPPKPAGRTHPFIPTKEEMGFLYEQAALLHSTGLHGGHTPDELMVMMLKGLELGIPPQQAVTQLYIADGKLTMQADLMRALVLRQGGKIRPTLMTDVGCVVEATRPTGEVTEVRYTMQDAEKAGLTGSAIWQKYPRQLLFARATSEACRVVFSDMLLGTVYTPEELGNHQAPLAVLPVDAPPSPAEASVGPTPPLPIPPVAPTSLPGRALTHSFLVEKPGGGVRVVQTAGIIREQLRKIGDLTTARAGIAQWQENQAAAKAWIQARGVSDLIYLSEEEGWELIGELDQVEPESPPIDLLIPTPVEDVPQATPVELLAKDMGIPEEAENLERFLCETHGVKHVAQLTQAQLVKGLSELRAVGKDPKALLLMMERARQAASA